MTTRKFHLRLNASYEGEENNIKELGVEMLTDEGWEALKLDIRSPGFLLFINGLFSCQHLYMRVNSAESDLILSSAVGEMKVVANENWEIQDAEVSFNSQIKSGNPSDARLAYITERMHHCPVSSNLPEHLKLKVSVTFQD